jgi:hypothetical protein
VLATSTPLRSILRSTSSAASSTPTTPTRTDQHRGDQTRW